MDRREVIKRAGGALAGVGAAAYVPARLLGASAPSNRITMGCIGVGGMGTNNMRAFLNFEDVQVVAVCDPVRACNEYGHWYSHRWEGAWFGREPARKIVDAHYGQLQVSNVTSEFGISGTRFTVIIPRNLMTPEMRRQTWIRAE